jgi:DNA (cytosine-5)-methyltransferase 1
MYEEFDISFFIFENVVGLLRKRYRHRLFQLTQALDPDFQIFMIQLNAAHYGVPQVRERLFVIGLNRERCANAIFLPPVPTHEKPRTIREAIGGLEKPVYFSHGLDPKTFPVHPNHWTMRPKSDKFSSGLLRKKRLNGRSFRVLDWSRPSWTVSYGHREIHIHPRGYRRLSVYEAMLLQGFPPDYRIFGALSDQVRLVSDAVPPALAQAVARSLRATLDSTSAGWNRVKPTALKGIQHLYSLSTRPTAK